MKNNIAVLGSNGFIGKYITNKLNAIGIEKNNYQYFDYFINCNGNSSKVLAETDPIANFNANVNSTLNTLFNFKFDTYIHISSCEVYENISSNAKTRESTEIDFTKLSNYGLSKYFAECLVKRYCKKWLILRLNGPIANNLRKGPIFDILHGENLWVSDKSEFQFIHMSSVSDFIKHLIEKNITNEIFNVTGSNFIEIKTAMRMLKREVPCPDKPIIKHRINVDKFSKFEYITTSKNSVRRLIDQA